MPVLTNGHAINGGDGLNSKATNGIANGKHNVDDLGEHEYSGFSTIAIHGGHEPEQWDMNQVVPPISLSTTYKQPKAGEPIAHDYSRAGNPTRDVLQKNLAGLEGAKQCYVYSSGMSAVTAIVDILRVGDHLICADDGYGGTQRYLRKVGVEKHGLDVSLIDFTDFKQLKAALKNNTKMIWFETPSNPMFKIIDIQGVVELVREYNKNIIVVVDNTFMTPYFQKPLKLGADVVMHSLTKYINGHSDVVMGALMTNNAIIGEHLKFMQLCIGAVPSAFDSYLVIRGIKTLAVRMRAHEENAFAVAKFLEESGRVERVIFPGFPSHSQYKVHNKQTNGASGMLGFYLKGGINESHNFLSELKVFKLAESLGGCDSLAELPAVMTHASVPANERAQLGITDNYIRVSVGIEDKEDLIEDLDRALKKAIPNHLK